MVFHYENHIFEEPGLPVLYFPIRREPGSECGWLNWHKDLELTLVRSGEGWFQCDNERIPAAAGDVVVFNADELHNSYTAGGILELIVLVIDSDFLQELGAGYPETRFENRLRDPRCTSLIERIAQEIQANVPYRRAAVKALVAELAVLLCRSHASAREPGEDLCRSLSAVRRALRYIGDHLTEPLTLDDICAQVGFSKYHFCRIFREATNKTVVEYINGLRCMQAHVLLASGATVAQAAEESGFPNPSYFTTQYKKHMGVLPSEDRRPTH